MCLNGVSTTKEFKNHFSCSESAADRNRYMTSANFKSVFFLIRLI